MPNLGEKAPIRCLVSVGASGNVKPTHPLIPEADLSPLQWETCVGLTNHVRSLDQFVSRAVRPTRRRWESNGQFRP